MEAKYMQTKVSDLFLIWFFSAYAFAQLGDMTKAKHFLTLHKEFLGEYGQADSDEQLKL